MKIVYPEVKIRDVWRIFWQAMREHLPSLGLGLSGSILGSTFVILTPVFYKKFFDAIVSFVGDKNTLVPELFKIILIVLGLNLVMWASWRLSGLAINRFQTNVMAKLKQRAFDAMILHSHSFFVNNFGGALVQRVSRFSRSFERLADRVVYDLLSLFVKIAGIGVVVWLINPSLSALIIFWVVVFFVLNYFFARWKLKYDIKQAASDSATTAVLADAITNHQAIALFNGHDRESGNIKQVSNHQAWTTRVAWDVDLLGISIQSALVILLEFIVMYAAVYYWKLDLITAGTFVLLQVYVVDLGEKVFSFSRIVRDVYEGYADAKEMVEIMKLPLEIQDTPGAKPLVVKQGEIVLANVLFNFGQHRAVLKDINVQIKPGEKVALVGPSGAGKTTFVKSLLRFHDITSGKIMIDGQDIKQVTKHSLYEAMSLVPQDPVLFHRTLRENIRYGRPGATDEEVETAAKLAYCEEFIRNTPEGYDTYVGERGIKLSGGERQRIAIARAILKNAPILILDEATSSLDSHSEKLIQEALGNLMKGRTTIVIAHRLSTIRQMDRIIVIDRGQVVEEGTHDTLSQKPDGLYKHLWQLQAGGFLA